MKKKNGWLLAAGILSIVEAVGLFCCALYLMIALIASHVNSGADGETSVGEGIGLAFATVICGFFLFIVVICFIISVCNAVSYMKNCSKTYEELHVKNRLILTIVFSFLFGGLIIGILGLIGFLNKPEGQDYAIFDVDNNQQVESEKEVEKELQDLKNLFDAGVISEAEYKEKRAEILKNL